MKKKAPPTRSTSTILDSYFQAQTQRNKLFFLSYCCSLCNLQWMSSQFGSLLSCFWRASSLKLKATLVEANIEWANEPSNCRLNIFVFIIFWKLTWSVQLNEQPKRLKKNLKNVRLDRDRSLIFEMTGIILWTVGKDFFFLPTRFGENQIPLYSHLFLINLLLSVSFWIRTIFKPSPRWDRILSKIRKYSVSTNHL